MKKKRIGVTPSLKAMKVGLLAAVVLVAVILVVAMSPQLQTIITGRQIGVFS